MAEARRLARRRVMAEAVGRRVLDGGRSLPPAVARSLADRADRRARALRSRFHRTLDALYNADAFDEALAVFRDRNDRTPWPKGRP